MNCDRCGADALLTAEYSGAHLCGEHLCASVEKRVRRRIREDNLLSEDATPEDPERWVIGLSGGKDSVVLTQILHETFDADSRVDLVALSVHEGIEGYRDKSLAACEALTESLDIDHEVRTYEAEFGVRMDDVVEADPESMAACAYCGVFRRDILSRCADDLAADKLLTGHNLDDEAQSALMNVLEGDVEQIAQHFDSSLGPFPTGERHRDEGSSKGEATSGKRPDPTRTRTEGEAFVPRAKPLRDIPEKEVALYARVRDLPAHITECPHASEAYRGEIQDLLYDLEERHPGTRHSIMAGYERLAALAAEKHRTETVEANECTECGGPTRGDLCRKCDLLAALEAV